MKRLCALALLVFGALAACGYSGSATSGDAGEVDAAAPGDGAAPPDAATEAALDAQPNGNYLQVTTLESTTFLDIDAEGTLGWIHWGAFAGNDVPGMTVSKASLPMAIPTYTLSGTGNPTTSFGGFATGFMWTDGTPIVNGNDTSGVYSKGLPGELPIFHIDLRAGTTGQRLILYAGVHTAMSSLTVTLGDGASAVVGTQPLDASTTGSGNAYARWAIDYRAAQPDTGLTVAFALLVKLDGNSNIALAAATLLPMP